MSITLQQAQLEYSQEITKKVASGQSPYMPNVPSDGKSQFEAWAKNKYPDLNLNPSPIFSTRNIIIVSSVLTLGLGIFVYFKFIRK